jgi:hypothetical protein
MEKGHKFWRKDHLHPQESLGPVSIIAGSPERRDIRTNSTLIDEDAASLETSAMIIILVSQKYKVNQFLCRFRS